MRLLRNGFHYYISGIIVLAFGITLTIQSTLGTSPFDALLVGLYRTFGLSIGSWEIVVGTAMVLGNALVEKRRPEYYALLTSLITGIGIDSWMFVLSNTIIPTTWVGKYICVLLGIGFTALGVAIYLQSQFAPNPIDRSMLIISKITNWSVSYSRGLINVILVVIAFFFNGDIGIGTLINAVISGILINLFLIYLTLLKSKSVGDSSNS